ncbi:MAG: S41 family peptidase [Planctomycetota bacterium]
MKGILAWLAVSLVAVPVQDGPRLPEAARLIRELRHTDIARREAASRRLIELGPSALPFVTSLIDSPDTVLAVQARRIASALLGAAPEVERRVLGILTTFCAGEIDLNEAVRQIVAAGPVAQDHAVELLEHQAELRGTARSLYLHLRVVRDIGRLAEGDNRDDRARDALARLGSEAVEPLLRIASDSKWGRNERLLALWTAALADTGNRARTYAPLLSDPDPVLRAEAALLVADGIDASTFADVARALAGRDSGEVLVLAEAAARCLALSDLVSALSHREDVVVALAARALGSRRSLEALPHLVSAIGGAPTQRACGAILRALAEFDDPRARDALLQVFAESSEEGLRTEALGALKARADRASARIAFAVGLLDRSAEVRLQAADALALVAGEQDVSLLLFGLEDPNAAVRARVLATLTRVTGRQGQWDPRRDPLEDFTNWWREAERESGSPPAGAWLAAAREGARILRAVREAILDSYYPAARQTPLTSRELAMGARQGFERAFDDHQALQVSGIERQLLRRVLLESPLELPDEILRAVGCLPLAADPGDLVCLTTRAAEAMVEGLGDRYCRLVVSHDSAGRLLPEWLPGLLGDDMRSNGFSVERRDGAVWVHFVLQGAPAHTAGFRRGDQVIALNGTFVAQMGEEAIEEAISREVTVSMLRDGWSRPYDFHLVPADPGEGGLVSASVLPGGIGYLRLRSFDSGAAMQVERALRDLERAKIVGLVLDLRNNPGGSVAECVSIVDKFVDGGRTITIVEGPLLGGSQNIESTRGENDRTYPLAILVNNCSASAAEMCAGALRELDRATLVGQTTFGKGIGQGHVQIPGFPAETVLGETRSLFVLYLTELRYLLPGGIAVQGVGVEPDLVVPTGRETGPHIDTVMRVARHPAVKKFVEELLDRDPALSRDLATHGVENLPELDRLNASLKMVLDKGDLFRIVRQRLRHRLHELGQDADLPPDILEDRDLVAAVRHVARRAGVDLATLADYEEPWKESSAEAFSLPENSRGKRGP